LGNLVVSGLSVLLFLLSACSPETAARSEETGPSERVVVDNLELVLDDCTLRAGDKTHHFDFPEPCRFSVDRDGRAAVRETEHGLSLIVISISPIENSDDCDTYFKGVLVRNGSFWVSESQQIVALCDDGPLDEKNFEIFAYEISKRLEE